MAFIYTSQYPTHDVDHVKATTYYNADHYPHFTTDPTKSLTGDKAKNSWESSYQHETNQRFHIDLGSAKIIKRIYYENAHSNGIQTNEGVQNFTFWGSNSATAFAELTYATDTDWTQITPAQSTLDRHIDANQADPKYITVTNSTAYRYYAFKFANTWGSGNFQGVRRIELQTSEIITVPVIKTLPYILSGEGIYLRGGVISDGQGICQICFEVDSVNTDWVDGYHEGDIAKQFKAIDYSVSHLYRAIIKNLEDTVSGEFITIPPLDLIGYTMRAYEYV